MKTEVINKVHCKNGKMYLNNYLFADYKWQYAIEYTELKLALLGKYEADKLDDLDNESFVNVHSSFVEIKNDKAYAKKIY